MKPRMTTFLLIAKFKTAKVQKSLAIGFFESALFSNL